MHVQLRSYGLLYVAGLCVSWILIRAAAKKYNVMTANDVDNLMFWMSVGCVLGGRIGYVLFYGIALGTSPIEDLFRFNRGGMSFFGGLIAVTLTMYIFAWKTKKNLLSLTDLVAGSAPAGLFLGRIGNYFNREIFGPPTSLPWAITDPSDGIARHPTQLYEALLEGIVLLVILYPILWLRPPAAKPGLVSGLFLVLYSFFRALMELLRDDSWITGVPFSISQVLCIPVAVVGLYLIFRTTRLID
ncbi:prolipoprotein diacylglyceryl transferase [Mesorhizobium sp. M1227]|uniref:prolipoprotein diacylglyceryl transferase n=1 Tax=Mesorhizobium sp. M1227 TaxID=2957071 RepID=UPI00333C7C56